ncbi:hypothetical protein COO60DRAFT_1645776 [Scenedesmus sp. NREL 46B-D3]|nr:hypothetical protein COO60DRAFT_1645776 [Scenedesmus sp. NREL 46B-D3]
MEVVQQFEAHNPALQQQLEASGRHGTSCSASFGGGQHVWRWWCWQQLVHGSKTVEKAAPAKEEKKEAKKPAPAPAKKEEVVVVMVPHHCKMWAKFGYIHPDCQHYFHAAGRKL